MGVKTKRGLFTESLEGISRNLFKDHKEIITELIGDSSGIYALYDDNELYYVGRASDLKRRVNQHLKDRHDSQWTHFSLFLIKKVDYIGDIESLLVRIAEPVGNRAKPKGRDSKQLIKKLKSLIQKKHKEELNELISGRTIKKVVKKGKQHSSLVGLVEKRTPIYRTYKGIEYRALLTPKGLIYFRKNQFSSPTAAAKAVVGTSVSVNGWYFWRIKNASGDWVKLSEY
ncbi:MAG: DUF2924 domain-containing protein [Bacteroidetes bacterium]|nr:DUF2924 domain-containing protein [Bacteroidota bacterium]